MIQYEEWKNVLKNERLPLAVLDLDAFDRNIDRMAALSGHKPIRIASKSIRTPYLIKRVLNKGHPFQGVMTYSVEETDFLASQGFDDFLIAYPTVQSSELKILKSLHQKGKKIVLVVDSLETVEKISAHLGDLETPFKLIVEMDLSLQFFLGSLFFGVRRSPLRSVPEIVAFFKSVRAFKNVSVIGIMGYEAQVAGLGDRNPFRKSLNPIKSWIRKASIRYSTRVRQEVRQSLKEAGFSIELFNGGGTGSLNSSSKENCLTEVTGGSGLVCSHLFDYYSNIQFEPALFFALQVVRRPSERHVTCQGGGYVASGEPGWDKVPVPHLPKGIQLLSTEACGEVQTPLLVRDGMKIAMGDPILFRHAKAGELAERFQEYIVVSGGKIIDRVKTYRGFGQCFF